MQMILLIIDIHADCAALQTDAEIHSLFPISQFEEQKADSEKALQCNQNLPIRESVRNLDSALSIRFLIIAFYSTTEFKTSQGINHRIAIQPN